MDFQLRNMDKNLLDTAAKTGLDALKTATKRVQTMQKISMLSCRCVICQNIETSGTLCNYYRDEVIDDENKNNNDGNYKK